VSSTIATVIDFREKFGVVRDQGARPSCLACAGSDAHAHAQDTQPLSAEFLFFHSAAGKPVNGLTVNQVSVAMRGNGQPLETECPYSLVQPIPWHVPAVGALWRGALELINMSELKTTLAASVPVVLGVRITTEFLSLTSPPYLVRGNKPGHGGHAVLAVGLGHDEKGQDTILVRNSWGVGWGDLGCAWLHASYLDLNLMVAALVKASREEAI
jgi:hypothetical protein